MIHVQNSLLVVVRFMRSFSNNFDSLLYCTLDDLCLVIFKRPYGMDV